MFRCPITYKMCGKSNYSSDGLRLLDLKLKELKPFPFNPTEQRMRASQLAEKLSITGIQPKLSAILNVEKGEFEIVQRDGMFILKPPHPNFDELVENEDLTMKLAKTVSISVPLHGLLHNLDGSLTYFIKRFDRIENNRKLETRDFAQLLGLSDSKIYASSMEKIGETITLECVNPLEEKTKLFRLVLFNFLIGNEDMHVKNFTLINYGNGMVLSPAYDLINTTIVLKTNEEIALPIKGKKSRITHADLFNYFGSERLGLDKNTLNNILMSFSTSMTLWKEIISKSFLSQKKREQYEQVIQTRWASLNAKS